MVEALTSWAAQDEAGASFARHREKVCALGLGKDLEIEELTKEVKELEAFSAAEEKIGIDLRARTRKCGKMILATGEVVALKKKLAETEVLVADGDTTVIGGIYTRNTAVNACTWYSQSHLLLGTTKPPASPARIWRN